MTYRYIPIDEPVGKIQGSVYYIFYHRTFTLYIKYSSNYSKPFQHIIIPWSKNESFDLFCFL